MAEKKSLAQRIGEWWYNYTLAQGEAAMIQSEAQLATGEALLGVLEQIEIDGDITDEEREVISELHKYESGAVLGEALKIFFTNFSNDFSKGYNSAEWDNLSPDEKDAVRETQSKESFINKPTVAEEVVDTGASAYEIQSQMGAAFDADGTIQDAIGAPEVTNQDILKRTPIGGLGGQQLEMYLNAVAEGNLTPEQAYLQTTGTNLAAFVTDDDGKIQFEEVTKQDGTKVFVPVPVTVQPESLFMGGFVNHIRRQNPAAIEELKQFLVLNGIAEADDFDDSGEMDPALEGIIQTLMADANYKYAHVTYGSHEWNELVNSVPRNFGWVLDSDMDREKASWALLGRAIIDFKDDRAFIEKADIKAKEKEYEANIDIPGVGEMSYRIDNFFSDALGRPPTAEERNRFLNEWNTGYDTYVQKNIAAYKAATYGADMERYLIENGESITAEEEQALKDDIQAGGDVLAGIVGEREVETDFVTDEDIFYDTYWNMTQYTDKVKAGKDKREHQANLMKLITGKI